MKSRNEKTKMKRIDLIIDFFHHCNEGFGTISNLMDHLKKNKKKCPVVSKRTIEKDFQFIRNSDDSEYTIEKVKNGRLTYYVLNKKIKKPKISEDVKEDIGILLQLINTHEELESVLWLKELLKTKHNIDETHFENDDFFVLPKPKNENHDNILGLALKIVKHAKKGEVIMFEYLAAKKNKKDTRIKCCAPLQVRLYDNRYYLLAVDLNDDNNDIIKFKDYPVIYAVDSIVDLEITLAPIEYDTNKKKRSLNHISFNHAELSKKFSLKTYFDHCIGITKPNDSSPKKIKLKFTGWARSYVLNQPIHISQKVISSGEELIVEIFVYDTFELDFSLARFRGFCERMK